MQMEAENKQSNDNQNIKDVTGNEINEQSSEAIQPVNKKIEDLKQRSAANNEAIENEGNNKRTMDELRGISKPADVYHKPQTTTVNQQTLHAYKEQKRYH